jgi:hypothetical protein
MRMHYHPCLRRATITREGKRYCYQHDPMAVAARDKKRNAKYDADWAKKEKQWRRERAAFKALAFLEVLIGCAEISPEMYRKGKRIIEEANK